MDEILDSDYMNIDKNEFMFYRDYHHVEEAQALATLMKGANIPYSFETTDTLLDSSIVGTGLIPKIVLKLRPSDFEKINALILTQYKDLAYADVKEHYLNQLDDEELSDVLLNQDKWNIEDIAISKIILAERDFEINEDELLEIRNKRFEEIRQGKRGNRLWMTLYALGILFGLVLTILSTLTILFVLAGIGMSYYYAYGKTTDPDGNVHYVFDEETQQLGYIMFIGGIGVVVLQIGFIFWILA